MGYILAANEFNRLAVNYPASSYFEESIYMKAAATFESTPDHFGLDQSELSAATSLLEDFLIDFPESEHAEGAKEYLKAAKTRLGTKTFNSGVVYERMGAFKAAKKYFQMVVDDYFDTEFAAPATFKNALMEFRLKNFEDARGRFENFRLVFPEHELAVEATAMAQKAAYEHCKALTEATDSSGTDPSGCWQSFKADFPDSDKLRDVDKYLLELNRRQTVSEATPDSNDS